MWHGYLRMEDGVKIKEWLDDGGAQATNSNFL